LSDGCLREGDRKLLGLLLAASRLLSESEPKNNCSIEMQNFGKETITMNAFKLLKADHEKVAGIFEKLEPTTERGVKTREDLFTQLKTELDTHARIEETILYPALEDADKTHDLVLEAYEEHHVIKQLLAELDALAKDEEQWAAKLKVLQENVEHHVEEEEGELFPKAAKIFSAEEAEALGVRLEQAKKPKGAAAS